MIEVLELELAYVHWWILAICMMYVMSFMVQMLMLPVVFRGLAFLTFKVWTHKDVDALNTSICVSEYTSRWPSQYAENNYNNNKETGHQGIKIA